MKARNPHSSSPSLGELKKLGIRSVSRSTVVKILKEHGLDPGPKRGEGSWDDFVKTHAKTLWACDFFSRRVLTVKGWVDYYLILFIHLETRRLFITPATLHPTGIWLAQQARNFIMYMEEQSLQATHLILDNDTKFCEAFDDRLEAVGIEVKRVTPLAPNLNAYAERAIQTVKAECLDHFIVLGERHLEYLVQEFLAHYHEERPHQAKGNVPLTTMPGTGPPPDEPEALLQLRNVACRERLGGCLKHYYRKAA